MKRGRPFKKPEYAPKELMRELIDTVDEIYREKGEIKATALELDLPANKVKKLLITAKAVSYYPQTEQIQNLLSDGKTIKAVQEITGLSRAAINTYLPYSKVIYKLDEISLNAERVARYRERKAAVEKLQQSVHKSTGEDGLWNCVIAFQDSPFRTSSGLPFSYHLKIGRDGVCTRELFIDRRENSKSLAWSSVLLALRKIPELCGDVKLKPIFDRPKAVGDIRGISYIYSLFWRFGLIDIPEEIGKRMREKKVKKSRKD